ncbi:MAG: hypothetical protein NVSMB65_14920 [Chloroflexota bacterium]
MTRHGPTGRVGVRYTTTQDRLAAGAARGSLEPAPPAVGSTGGRATMTESPREPLERLSENLYLFRDTCNVYVIQDGDRAVLIDAGSGAVLDHLPALGIERVEWVLHTHHHRDQAQGTHLLVEAGARVAVPEHERALFAGVENFWRNRRVYDNYDVRNTFFTLVESVTVDAVLPDYETFTWGGLHLFILPTPGHTLGSISLLGEIDGRWVAFSGDLMLRPGKVLTLHDLQYAYGALDGVDMALFSLDALRRQRPDLLCPSHGAPLPEPEAGMAEVMARLRAWAQVYDPATSEGPGFRPTVEPDLRELTPHVVAVESACAHFYAILDDAGNAFFVDYGQASDGFFKAALGGWESGGHMRFVAHSLDALRARYGLRRIDLVMPSHYHDDHISGFPYLQRHEGTRVWAYHNMVELLEKPHAYNYACMLTRPIPVERALAEGEEFTWGGHTFRAVHSPGHTEFQMALFAEIDGRRLAFTGDNYFKGPDMIRHNVIYRNHVEADSHVISARKVLAFEPHVLCPGHGGAFDVSRGDLEAYLGRMQRQEEALLALLPEDAPNQGLDPSWASLYPYQIDAVAGETVTVEVRVRNYQARPRGVRAELVLPRGWQAEPEECEATMAGGATVALAFTVRVPDDAHEECPPRLAITADLTVGGEHLGQVAEAVVHVLEP